MKLKILLIMFIILSIILIIPSIVLGYEDVENYENYNITYQLFSDGTAKILSIEDDTLNNSLSINDRIWYQEEEYNVTSIEKNVFDSIRNEKELYLYFDKAPILEGENSFSNISNIYVGLEAEGYTKDTGWPIEKIKQYIIETQPQDIVVTPKEISEGVSVDTSASIAAGAGSIGYDWYLCDAEGNILDDLSVSSYASLKIPFDLSYDNENNLPKDYYYVCVIGEEEEFPEKTRVAKVTVNPGPYKVSFDCGELAQWSIESKDGLIETFTNNDRKLDKSDIPSSDLLVNNGKGVSFAGWWNVDLEKIVDPLAMTFEKNTYLTAMWKFKIYFDANGGAYADENTIYSIELMSDSSNFIYEYDVQEPTREGYEFLGFFTEKEEGSYFEDIMIYDGGISEETTFYAQWKALEKDENDDSDVDDSETDEPNTDDSNVEDSEIDEPNTDDSNAGDSETDEPNTDDPNAGDSEIDGPNTDDSNEQDKNNDKPIVNNSNDSPSNVVNKEEINTPHTGDDIFLYTVLLITSLGGILVTSVLKRNN